MERGRRLALGALGLAVMLLTAGLVLRAAGGGGDQVLTQGGSSTIEALSGDLGTVAPVDGIGPGDPPASFDPTVAPGLGDTVATLPQPSVATVTLPDLSTGRTTPTAQTTTTVPPPAFTERGVYVIRADGSSPILVARDATAGVGAGATWIAFVAGGQVRAVRRTDLRTTSLLASGVTGTAASGLPISGGKRGVAFLLAGRAVLYDPAAPGQPVLAFDAPGADAIAAEEDGQGRLVWADTAGLHVGSVEEVAPTEQVQRGMLAAGYGVVASQQGGQVAIRDGPRLAWGEIDRLQVGVSGVVAASAGRVHLRTTSGESRVLFERASTPVVSATRILYVSQGQTLASASLSGTGATAVATAGPGRSITNLDLLDDATLVVTVG